MDKEYSSRVASAFSLASAALRVAGLDRVAVLRKKYREDKKRSEWALLSKDGSRVLKWFGTQRPSDERVKKEEARVQYFKHQGAEDLRHDGMVYDWGRDAWCDEEGRCGPNSPTTPEAAEEAKRLIERTSAIRKSLTYGVLPSREEFDAAFDEEVPGGSFEIMSGELMGSRLPVPDGGYSADELWDVLEGIVGSDTLWDGVDQEPGPEDEAGLQFASNILSVLGFEWI